MSWKRVAGFCCLSVLTLIAAALIYPGIPAGVDITSSNRKVVLACSYLHWGGRHKKTVTIANPSGSYTFTTSDCPR